MCRCSTTGTGTGLGRRGRDLALDAAEFGTEAGCQGGGLGTEGGSWPIDVSPDTFGLVCAWAGRW